MATAVNPLLDGSQSMKVPHQPQIQRASLKDSRYARAHNGALEPSNPTTTRRADRHSLRPRVNGALDPSATITAKTPMKTRRPSQDSAGSVYGRTANGRQFTVGNIGNGGRIYLRYIHLSITFLRLHVLARRAGGQSCTSEPEEALCCYRRESLNIYG